MSKRIRIEPQKRFGEQLTFQLPADMPEPPSYMERMAKQRRQWKEQDRARFYNPDELPDGEKVWRVYAWLLPRDPKKAPEWMFYGERRKKMNRRKPMTMNRLFAAIRQTVGLHADVPVLLISVQDDEARKKRGESFPPPKRVETLRPHVPPKKALEVVKFPKAKPRKVRDTALKVEADSEVHSNGVVRFTFKTLYVGWGKSPKGDWFFLGSTEARTAKLSQNEIARRFPLMRDVRVLPVKSLKYTLRVKMLANEIVAGQTKMVPPQ